MSDTEGLKSIFMSVIICLLFGWLCGWLHAHKTVAGECEKLGRFYVGETVYECKPIIGTKKDGA